MVIAKILFKYVAIFIVGFISIVAFVPNWKRDSYGFPWIFICIGFTIFSIIKHVIQDKKIRKEAEEKEKADREEKERAERRAKEEIRREIEEQKRVEAERQYVIQKARREREEEEDYEDSRRRIRRLREAETEIEIQIRTLKRMHDANLNIEADMLKLRRTVMEIDDAVARERQEKVVSDLERLFAKEK